MQANNAMSQEVAISRQSMRAFLSALEEKGELVTVSQPVDLDYEIAGCLAEAADGPVWATAHRDGRSPPAQKSGGAPVMTTAGTPS